jgi:DNA-binding Lrp family transcriptional regulator
MAKEIPFEFHSNFNDAYSIVTRKIVRILSENARASVSDISKMTKLSRKTVTDRMRKLEQEMNLRYTVELDEEALGLSSPHIILVRFDEKPDYDHISKLFKESHVPQFAVSIKGSQSMLIFGIAVSNKDYAYWDNSIQIMLAKYGMNWQPSEVVHEQLGFLPIRNEMIEKLNIAPKYKQMLMLLNENSRMSFQELSKRMNMHFNTTAYNFKKLLKMNYIKRFTITMDAPKNVTLAAFLAKYTPKEGFENSVAKIRKAFMSDDELSIISRYLFCAPLIGTHDHFGIAAFDDFRSAYDHIAKYHKQALGIHIKNVACMELDRVLIGRLPIRSVDDKREYRVLDWTVEAERLK